MSRTDDKTYSYSHYLLWDLIETTTAIIVFCIPAIPIAFRSRPSSRFHTWLRARTKRITGQKAISEADRRHRWPQPHQEDYPAGEYRVVAEPGEGGLAEQERSMQMSRDNLHDEDHGVAGLIQMGILRTTEIMIPTREGSESRASSLHQGGTVYPWSEEP